MQEFKEDGIVPTEEEASFFPHDFSLLDKNFFPESSSRAGFDSDPISHSWANELYKSDVQVQTIQWQRK